MAKYTLVGQNGNAYAIIGYTAHALRAEGLSNLIPKMQDEAMKSDYNHLVVSCYRYMQMANEKAIENGWEDEEKETS